MTDPRDLALLNRALDALDHAVAEAALADATIETYRELLSVALERLYGANRTIASLRESVANLRDDLRALKELAA